MFDGFRKRNLLTFGLSAMLGLLLLAASAQSTAATIDQEIAFAAALVEANFPEYADSVVATLLERYPDDPDILERANVIRAETLIARRRFDEARVLLDTLPAESPRAQAIRLAMAKGYYLTGDYEATAEIYDAFFQRYADEAPTDPDLIRFVSEAAFQYAQMLIMRNDPAGAAAAYAHVLRVMDESEVDLMRKIKVERSEMLLRAAEDLEPGEERTALIEPAIEHCHEVLWGGMDLWFGRAVICLAQSYVLLGDPDEAIDLLQTNLRMLRTVDNMMREAEVPLVESPLAGARSLLARLYAEEADLLTGPAIAREAAALAFFEKALEAYRAVWRVVLRANQRDVRWLASNPTRTVADLAPDLSTAGLDAVAPDRQAPFTRLIEALGSFQQQMDTVAGPQGWATVNRERAVAIRTATLELAEMIRNHDQIAVGATPSREMELGERFAGNALVRRALDFLADEATRRAAAVRRYTQALQHDYHVFINYAGGSWARESGPRVDVLKARLEQLTGQTVTIDVGAESRLRSGLAMITEGRNLFRQNQYAEAVERFTAGLNIRPEGDHAMGVLSTLLDSYTRLERKLHVRMLIEYIGERFGDHPNAPQALLRVGRYYYDQDDPAMALDIYERYLRLFDGHFMAPTILYMLGEQRWQLNDYDNARGYYQRLVEKYPQSAEFVRALNRIGWSYYLQDQHAEAADFFIRVVETAPHGMLRAEAKLSLADALRQTGQYMESIRHYRQLSQWVSASDSIYQGTQTNREQSEKLREQAMFYQGHCLSRVAEPAEQLPEFRRAAVALFREFVNTYPRSNLAPLALGSMGAVLLSNDQPDEAAEVYDELARAYPESEIGRDARFAMIRSLVDIGQLNRARTELTLMIEESERYSSQQFMRLGTIFHEAGAHETAIRALDLALDKRAAADMTDDQRRSLDQRARMLLGRSHFTLRNYDEAVRHVTHLIENYPASALFFEARFLLGQSLQALNRPDEAIEVLREVFRQAPDQQLINRATLVLGELQVEKGQVTEALASYQRIVLLENPNNPQIRPIYEKALARSVGLFSDLQRWGDVVNSADSYLRLFPSGDGVVDVRGWRVQAVMQRGEQPEGTP